MFSLTIHAENDAFYNPDGVLDPAAEIASILEALCLQLRDGSLGSGPLYDTNGNKVGGYRYGGSGLMEKQQLPPPTRVDWLVVAAVMIAGWAAVIGAVWGAFALAHLALAYFR